MRNMVDAEGMAWKVKIDGWWNVGGGRMCKEGREKMLLLMEDGCFGCFLTFSPKGNVRIKMHSSDVNLDIVFR